MRIRIKLIFQRPFHIHVVLVLVGWKGHESFQLLKKFLLHNFGSKVLMVFFNLNYYFLLKKAQLIFMKELKAFSIAMIWKVFFTALLLINSSKERRQEFCSFQVAIKMSLLINATRLKLLSVWGEITKWEAGEFECSNMFPSFKMRFPL